MTDAQHAGPPFPIRPKEPFRFFVSAAATYSNSGLGSHDCLMIDISVPVRSSLWSGTGMVMVLPDSTLLHDYVAPLAPDLGKFVIREYFADFPTR